MAALGKVRPDVKDTPLARHATLELPGLLHVRGAVWATAAVSLFNANPKQTLYVSRQLCSRRLGLGLLPLLAISATEHVKGYKCVSSSSSDPVTGHPLARAQATTSSCPSSFA